MPITKSILCDQYRRVVEDVAKHVRNQYQNQDTSSGRITCEKCGNKINTYVFDERIRQSARSTPDANMHWDAIKNNVLIYNAHPRESSRLMSSNSPSVLNAIEELIEKSGPPSHVASNFTENNKPLPIPNGSQNYWKKNNKKHPNYKP